MFHNQGVGCATGTIAKQDFRCCDIWQNPQSLHMLKGLGVFDLYKVVVIGGGWSGCAAAVAARKAGAEVVLLEKTDMLLGLGNVGGIMRNNGRFTAAEENIALGAHELFDITDACARHINVDFPGHKHASLYDVVKVEPQVRKLLQEMGVDIRVMSRAIDVEKRDGDSIIIDKIILAGGEAIEGDVFVETTGSTDSYRYTQGVNSYG